MDRALAGVVAALQEVEIALKNLLELPTYQSHRGINQLLHEVRLFFQETSLEKAKNLAQFLKDQDDGVLVVKTVVDGIETSLEALSVELDEVIEDAEVEMG